jgi:hypothetical protein
MSHDYIRKQTTLDLLFAISPLKGFWPILICASKDGALPSNIKPGLNALFHTKSLNHHLAYIVGIPCSLLGEKSCYCIHQRPQMINNSVIITAA